MRVHGTDVTEDQLRAGIAEMRGEFRMVAIIDALIRAGVPAEKGVAGRAADRLLQRERKAGRIVAVHNKLWRSTAD